MACENILVLEAVGSTGRLVSLEDVAVVVVHCCVSLEEFVANLSNVSFKTPLLCESFDINFSLSDLNRLFSSTNKFTGAGTSRIKFEDVRNRMGSKFINYHLIFGLYVNVVSV